MVLKIGEVEQNIHSRLKVASSGSTDRFFYHVDATNEAKSTGMSDDDADDQEVTDEVIDLNAMPDGHAEDFQAESDAEAQKTVTLDDVIVSKNE